MKRFMTRAWELRTEADRLFEKASVVKEVGQVKKLMPEFNQLKVDVLSLLIDLKGAGKEADESPEMLEYLEHVARTCEAFDEQVIRIIEGRSLQ